MTFRPEVVRERLKRLRQVLRNLARVREITRHEFLADYRHQWLAERGLQLAAEVVFDIGNHILAGALNVSASHYEDVIAKLSDGQVISRELADRMRGLGGFRNILVHGYVDLDPARVHKYLQTRLGDFTLFIEEIDRYLDRDQA